MSDHEDPISDEKDALELARFKNKLAQKRYRDRQRVKKSNLFSHIASLERKLARLQTTHEDLEAKNKSLEEVANLVKEEQGSPSLSEQKSGVAPVAKASQNLILNWSICFAEYVNATRMYEKPILLPKDLEGHAMTAESLKRSRMYTANSLSKIVKDMPSITPATQQEIERFILKTRARKAAAMACYCSVRTTCKGSLLHSAPNKHDPQVFKLVETMKLTKSQKCALLAAKQTYEKTAEGLRSERQILTSWIRQKVFNSAMTPTQDPYDDSSLVGSDLETIQLLESNLEAEGHCLLQLATACDDIILPVQEAVALMEGSRFDVTFELMDIPGLLYEIEKTKILDSHRCATQLYGSSVTNLDSFADFLLTPHKPKLSNDSDMAPQSLSQFGSWESESLTEPYSCHDYYKDASLARNANSKTLQTISSSTSTMSPCAQHALRQ